ncbi:hypothetical protein CA85_51730 [Allorhodopirellula solitaria]|uniref:Uncharacterized protein n=1 Tax=Allorhodopirellula solitaria TaxID=2527987 RepID=A0A5C5WP38_9BACT|nr:hypothetical protein CA85_51730 [Allorhodopirellula solitaria]
MTDQTLSPRTRRFLSADALFKLLRNRFEAVQDDRKQANLTGSSRNLVADSRF